MNSNQEGLLKSRVWNDHRESQQAIINIMTISWEWVRVIIDDLRYWNLCDVNVKITYCASLLLGAETWYIVSCLKAKNSSSEYHHHKCLPAAKGVFCHCYSCNEKISSHGSQWKNMAHVMEFHDGGTYTGTHAFSNMRLCYIKRSYLNMYLWISWYRYRCCNFFNER